MNHILSTVCFALALLLSATFAKAAPLDTFRDCDVCPEMIELPVGAFMMGAPLGELQPGFQLEEGKWRLTGEEPPFYNTREQPMHQVTIDIPFAMSRNEVTYDEWMACVNDGGCNGYVPYAEPIVRNANRQRVRIEIKGSYPVSSVSYDDALSYVDWINQKASTTQYRLPTEAEWEYAARAGTKTPFAQGMDVTREQVNYWDEVWQDAQISGEPEQILSAIPVRVEELDAANKWGLRHMSGNVAELTMSCESDQHQIWSLSSQYLQNAMERNECDRVWRGGHFAFSKGFVRVGFRSPVDDGARLTTLGFRVLRELNPLVN